MYNRLIQLITANVTLSEKERDLCIEYFEPVLYPKSRILQKQGEVPRYMYFIISGFIRLFHYNDKCDELTTQINCPTGFITSYTSFANQSKSDENLQTITECELLRITKTNLDLLLQKSPAFKDFSILVFQQSLSYNEKRSKELASLTAQERYLKLMQEHPEVLHKVPMQYIASFLGMNPKSLSRIRKQIIR